MAPFECCMQVGCCAWPMLSPACKSVRAALDACQCIAQPLSATCSIRSLPRNGTRRRTPSSGLGGSASRTPHKRCARFQACATLPEADAWPRAGAQREGIAAFMLLAARMSHAEPCLSSRTGQCRWLKVRVCTQVDLTHAVGTFLVKQARGSTHAPASSQEEDALLIYNYQTTFTGKVGL